MRAGGAALVVSALGLAACSGSTSSESDAGGAADASTDSPDAAAQTGVDGSVTADASSPADGGAPADGSAPVDAGGLADGSAPADAGGLTNAVRTAAVNATTTSNALCTKLGDFYWSIGDVTGTLGSGAVGTTYTATKALTIASASKFVFGAYMIESTQGQLTAMEMQELRMLSGYYGLNPAECAATPTVAQCLNAGNPGPNYSYAAADVGKFYYGGAHDEFFANTAVADGGLGLGAYTTDQLNTLIMGALKNPGFAYAFPEFAGGISSSPAQFATFLQSIVAGKLLIHDYLGVNAVCTLPGASCPNAVASPIPLAWHYSYNHWVEDDGTSDGAFSSAGAFGFYPWISADKTLYGVLAREDKASGNGDGDGTGPGYDSAACGLKLRAAWNTGVAQ
jgi:hypothetical protein